MDTVWTFKALDSLFFRDSRPMNAGETVWIESQFPPTGRTLQGAIRTAILNHLGVSFHDFLHSPDQEKLRTEIGDGDNLGLLDLSGPFLLHNKVPLYPVPLDLMRKREGNDIEFSLLSPSETVTPSDLGEIRFPVLKEGKLGFKPITDCFVDEQGMMKLLQGEADSTLSKHIYVLRADDKDEKPLTFREYKVGLARNNQTRTAMDGRLFAIAQVRPGEDLEIAVPVRGLQDHHVPQADFIQLLGGEGKMAKVSVASSWKFPEPEINDLGDSVKFKLVFITPASFPGSGWLPETASCWSQDDGASYWEVSTSFGTFDVLSGCMSKPFRQGGWNHALRYPRDLRSYIPAGSVYFCRASASQKEKILKLHTQKIGCETEYGFGQVLVGHWE